MFLCLRNVRRGQIMHQFQLQDSKNVFKINSHSMTTSLKEFSIRDLLPHPTLTEIPTMKLLCGLQTIDAIFDHERTDIYNICKQVIELKQCLGKLDCQIDIFRTYAIKNLSLISGTFDQFAIDKYYHHKLLLGVRNCLAKWKNMLMKQSYSLGKNASDHEIFRFKSQRNTYLLGMLRTMNKVLSGSIQKMAEGGKLTASSKKYLKLKGLDKSFESVWLKMIQVLNQKQEQTHLKILLIHEFLRYCMNYAKVCVSELEVDNLFKKFYLLVQYLCRILKKFYHQKLFTLIKQSILLVCDGFKLEIGFISKRLVWDEVKISQLRNLIQLISGHQGLSNNSSIQNKNTFVIRFLFRIVFDWKTIYLESQKLKLLCNSKPTSQFCIAQYIRKEKSQTIKENIYKESRPSNIKNEIVKMNRSLSQLQRRKSQSRNGLRQVQKGNIRKLDLEPINKIKMRNILELTVSQYVTRSSSVKEVKNGSKRKLTYFQNKANEDEKELKLQDYLCNNRKKTVSTTNKIRLYNAQKMANYCRGTAKVKLKLT